MECFFNRFLSSSSSSPSLSLSATTLTSSEAAAAAAAVSTAADLEERVPRAGLGTWAGWLGARKELVSRPELGESGTCNINMNSQRYTVQRLPTTPFSLVLCKEYFDYPIHRETLTQYITLTRGERGDCTAILYSVVFTLTSCIVPCVRLVTKSPKVRPLLICSISL
jgi:hypothetical protein